MNSSLSKAAKIVRNLSVFFGSLLTKISKPIQWGERVVKKDDWDKRKSRKFIHQKTDNVNFLG